MPYRSGITWICSGLAMVLLCAASAPQLMADSFSVRALTAAYDQNTGFNTSDSGTIAAFLATAGSGPITDFGDTFSAQAYASFTPLGGPSLGVYSDMVNTFALFQSFTPAQSWWSDTFTVTGAPGTQVSYNVGIDLHAILHSVKAPGSPSNLGAEASVQMAGTGLASGLSIIGDIINTNDTTINSALWRTVVLNVGDVVTVGATLSSDATAQLGSATVDALSTGLFALQVLTPGGGYTTASGTQYLTSFDSASPEPGTIVLLGGGLIAAVLRRRKKA